MPRILHILSQRPGRTGSGVTLDAIVRGGAGGGWQQHVIFGTDTSDPQPAVGDLPASHVHPLVFGREPVDFPLPGMSDVMPYASTVFSSMSASQLDAYRNAWREHVRRVIEVAKPDIIHSHHIWLLSAMLKDVAPHVPVVTSCHATGLRQMELCPHLADEVRLGCARIDHFATLHHGHAAALAEKLNVAVDRISVVGGGFNEALFHARGRAEENAAMQPDRTGVHLLYAGKYSRAKGVPWLLDAFEQLAAQRTGLVLHIAGTGTGDEADALRQRMERMACMGSGASMASMSPGVVLHGQVDQPSLAALMRQADVFVLPSFYEGLPLVLVEAAACGCRLVATALPGVVEQLAQPLAHALDLVALPRLRSVDEPEPADLPAFVDRLASAIDAAIRKPSVRDISPHVQPFTWRAVCERIEKVWNQLLGHDRD